MLTRDLAEQYATAALGHATREYPNKPEHVLTGSGDLIPPRALHPIFFRELRLAFLRARPLAARASAAPLPRPDVGNEPPGTGRFHRSDRRKWPRGQNRQRRDAPSPT